MRYLLSLPFSKNPESCPLSYYLGQLKSSLDYYIVSKIPAGVGTDGLLWTHPSITISLKVLVFKSTSLKIYGPSENVKALNQRQTPIRTWIFFVPLCMYKVFFVLFSSVPSTILEVPLQTRFSTRFFLMVILCVDEWVAGFCELAGSVSDGNVEVPSQWCEVALSALSHVAWVRRGDCIVPST